MAISAMRFFEVWAEGLNDFHLSVMNRYGARVFEMTNPTFKWSVENNPQELLLAAAYRSCSAEPKEMKEWVKVMK